MRLRLFTHCLKGLFWLLFITPLLLNAQQEQQAPDFDISAPIDTVEPQLVAKGGPTATYSPITDAVVRERLSYLSGCLNLQSNAVVRSYIRHYVQTKPDKTRLMLARRLTYFPIFEKKLAEYGLPNDLKYLAVVESALNPKAVSVAGASGLWQFMPSTGGEYGLRQNGSVDERNNPVESTEAAMRYLGHLYRQYNDWALALAAYNSGPTRVSSAIRRAGSRNFWVIQRYLPEETRNYVPAFIAATYICNYFQQHGLRPTYPDLDEQLTAHIKVYEGMSFYDIVNATGVSIDVVRNLNPGYSRGHISARPEGQYVLLPQRVMPAFIRYMNSLSPRIYEMPESMRDAGVSGDLGGGRYVQATFAAPKAGNAMSVAAAIGMCAEHLMAWNNLAALDYIQVGQLLKIWHPIIVQKHSSVRINPPASVMAAAAAPAAPVEAPPATPAIKKIAALRPISERKNKLTVVKKTSGNQQPLPVIKPIAPVQYQWHTLRRNESLQDVARQYGVTPESLRQINNVEHLKVGTRIKVKSL
jgi:membrane-bound lytic murein transglycosylase D